jgi:LemA protein
MNKKVLTGCGIALGAFILLIIIIYGYFVGSYNNMVQMDEDVKEKWGQVENVYQRRFDLIPNLVETVRGYASHERETFQMVTEARSRAAGTLELSEGLLDNPEMFQQFQQSQAQLSSALSRLMVVVEDYPDLKANQNFLALQDQLEGTENRIAVERRRFNESARNYNTYIRQFPRVFIANLYGFEQRPYFTATEGADEAPQVEF